MQLGNPLKSSGSLAGFHLLSDGIAETPEKMLGIPVQIKGWCQPKTCFQFFSASRCPLACSYLVLLAGEGTNHMIIE